MRLVFIYGPPAAGKLTIARELAHATGYRLFHNHLTRDAVTALFPHDSPAFTPAVRGVRLALLQAAADLGVPGVVFTFVYFRGEDDPFVDDVCEIVESRGGEVCFVRLVCDRVTLASRVGSESRRRLGKLVDPRELDRYLAQHDVFAPVAARPKTSASTPPRSAPLASAREVVRTLRPPRRGAARADRLQRAAGGAHLSGVRRIDLPAGLATRIVPSFAARG